MGPSCMAVVRCIWDTIIPTQCNASSNKALQAWTLTVLKPSGISGIDFDNAETYRYIRP